MDLIKQIQDAIVTSVKTMIDRAIFSARFDHTHQARIVEKISEIEYIVEMQTIKYNIKSNNGSTYKVGETVKVCVPLNNFDEMFILPKGISAGDISIGVESVNGKTGIVTIAINDIPNLSVMIGNINKDISEHKAMTVNSEVGAHDLRWFNNKLEVFVEDNWVEIIDKAPPVEGN